MRFLEVVVALAIKKFEQRRPKLTSRERRKINSRTHMYLFMTGLPYRADRATRLSGSPHLSCKRDQNKIRNHMDRRVTPRRRVTSPSWGPPPACKLALNQILTLSKFVVVVCN